MKDKSNILIGFAFCIVCFILASVMSDCFNHHGAKVRVQPMSYKPCYIRLDEEQFERLIEVLKKDE